VRKTLDSDSARPHLLQSEFSVNMREIFNSTPKPLQQCRATEAQVVSRKAPGVFFESFFQFSFFIVQLLLCSI
jgi:hypothetical protein